MIIKFEGVSEEGLIATRKFLESPENILHPRKIRSSRLKRKPWLGDSFRNATLPDDTNFALERRAKSKPEITLDLQENFRRQGCEGSFHNFDTPRLYLRRLLKAVGPYRLATIKCHLGQFSWATTVHDLSQGPTIWHHHLSKRLPFEYTAIGVFYAHFLRLDFHHPHGCDCVVQAYGAIRDEWLTESNLVDIGNWYNVPNHFMYRLMTILNKFVPSSNAE